MALAMVDVASEAGYRARVVRRYRHGSGWEYVCRVDGFGDQTAASSAASRLVDLTGMRVSIFSRAASHEDTRDDLLATTDAGGLLLDVLAAHEGPTGRGLAVLDEADQVLLSFRRRVPNGPVVKHTWARRGDDTYLRIEVESGEGRSSAMGVVEGAAWMAVEDGAPSPSDADRTLEVVHRFRPIRVLGFAARLGTAELRPTLDDPELRGTATVGKRDLTVVGSGRLELGVERQSKLVYAVRDDDGGGDLRILLDDYVYEAGIPVPRRIRTWRGDRALDDIEILQLTVDEDLPGDWFPLLDDDSSSADAGQTPIEPDRAP